MEFRCPECDLIAPHDHGSVYAPNGYSAPAIIYRSDHDPYAEVRDDESGEVIFPATKRPLRLIVGGKTDEEF